MTFKPVKYFQRNLSRVVLWGVPLLLMGMMSQTMLSALPYGSGTYGTCTYDTCGITLLTSVAVNLTATPTPGGVNSTAKDDVSVETDASTGYTLTLLDSDTDTDLDSTGDSIAASAGTQASPITLAMNTWGYRIDGLSGFGAGPTSAQSSDPSATYAFAGVPASNLTAHTLKTTSAAANPADVTEVWYGVRVDTTKPDGIYSDQVTYTAVTND